MRDQHDIPLCMIMDNNFKRIYNCRNISFSIYSNLYCLFQFRDICTLAVGSFICDCPTNSVHPGTASSCKKCGVKYIDKLYENEMSRDASVWICSCTVKFLVNPVSEGANCSRCNKSQRESIKNLAEMLLATMETVLGVKRRLMTKNWCITNNVEFAGTSDVSVDMSQANYLSYMPIRYQLALVGGFLSRCALRCSNCLLYTSPSPRDS